MSEVIRVKGLPLLGSLIPISIDALGFFTRVLEQKGDRIALSLGGRDVLLLCHPDDIEAVLIRDRESYGRSTELLKLRPIFGQGLLASEGDHWRRQRSMIQPSFGREALRSYASTMRESIDAVLDEWQPKNHIDVHSEMMRYTRNVIWKVLFSESMSDQELLGGAVTTVFGDLRSEILYLPLWRRLPLPRSRRWNDAVHLLNRTIRSKVDERRSNGVRRDDLLDALLHVTDASGGSMSDDEVHDEILTFFLAGHETAALSLTWACYLLACHPETQTRIKREVRALTGDHAWDAADLSALPFTTAVVKESMRLYPPVWSMGRRAARDTELHGHAIRRGTDIWICLHRLHRDARWYENARDFMPERWLVGKPKPYTYLPFGTGPRTCIGQHFAMTEAVLGLAAIVSRFSFLTRPDPVKTSAWITLRPKQMQLEVVADSEPRLRDPVYPK